jgi:hypothetical protein
MRAYIYVRENSSTYFTSAKKENFEILTRKKSILKWKDKRANEELEISSKQSLYHSAIQLQVVHAKL